MAQRFVFLTALALFVLTSGLRAQSAVAGKWRGQTPNGFSLEMNLTVTEQVLTGTLIREGEPSTITEGKVSANTFTFTVTLNSDEVEKVSGEVDGDQMKAWLDRQGPSMAAVLKRVK